VEGTLIRLQVDHLPGQRQAKPIRLWSSHTGADSDDPTAEVIRCWRAYLRRFDLEHTSRLFKQILGGGRPPRSAHRKRRPLDLAGCRRAHPAAACSSSRA